MRFILYKFMLCKTHPNLPDGWLELEWSTCSEWPLVTVSAEASKMIVLKFIKQEFTLMFLKQGLFDLQ